LTASRTSGRAPGNGITQYTFDRSKSREEIYSIDAPPLTASGSLHIGHAFSYAQTDVIARFQRMRGKAVFYPVGWDDNGLATERRVQNYYRISCDPSLPYQPDLVPPRGGEARGGVASGGEESPGQPGTTAAARVPVSRRNFIEFCRERTRLDEQAYEQAWRQLGLSVDWSTRYRTIEDRPAAVAQRAFLRALAAGDAYQALGPVLWDVTFGTAIAQAETEDREQAASCWRLAFGLVTDREAGSPASQSEVVVVTTRPELLPACVALVAHPEDQRYRSLVGSVVRTPLFNVAVPVLAHHLAEPAKGTGIAMVCTFGDLTDVTWWRDLGLPARPVLGADGRLRAEPPAAVTDEAGRAAYAQLACLTARTASTKVTELLAAAGALRGQPEPVRHPVKFYENGDAPLEIITARQWYVANGSRDPRLRDRLLSRGRELAWHPAHMRTRYENWVNGLTGDWLISRQRFFGVPIPSGIAWTRAARQFMTPLSGRPMTRCRSIRWPSPRPGISQSNATSQAASPVIPT
jgi:valyl-tRNA synthetase